MPGKGKVVVVDGLVQVFIRAGCVGVAHVVDYGNGDLTVHASSATGGEAQDVRGGGAVGGGDLVVVRGVRLEAGNLDLMEVLAALGDSGDQGAGRGAAVAGIVSCYCTAMGKLRGYKSRKEESRITITKPVPRQPHLSQSKRHTNKNKNTKYKTSKLTYANTPSPSSPTRPSSRPTSHWGPHPIQTGSDNGY